VTDLSGILAGHTGTGFVTAPAGYGKTHLIAAAVGRAARRQLVLTHTFAGVSAIRRKMRLLRVPASLFQIDTIASWALRFACAYPGISNWTVRRPEGQQWDAMYAACGALLDTAFAHAVVKASYAGFYVDEYQDCSTEQHTLVLTLARDLPCRILGDPLQGLFDFAGQPLIDWARDVAGICSALGILQTPERWNRVGSPPIGTWLNDVRQRLEAGQPIDLTSGLPSGVHYVPAPVSDLLRIQGNTCRYNSFPATETVAAIHGGSPEQKAKCHHLARQLGGLFSSIEEVEGKDLFSFFDKIGRAANNAAKLKHLNDFAATTLTSVNASLTAACLRGEHTDIRGNTKNPLVATAANTYLADASSANMLAFFQALRAITDVSVVRGDLFDRATGVLRKHIAHPLLPLDEAVEKYQSEFRHRGRFGGRRRIIGTTLLLKGLEFDHGIVLDASALPKKHLYVALTRAAKSLTIISTKPTLNPTA
jgi:hypothetical protein